MQVCRASIVWNEVPHFPHCPKVEAAHHCASLRIPGNYFASQPTKNQLQHWAQGKRGVWPWPQHAPGCCVSITKPTVEFYLRNFFRHLSGNQRNQHKVAVVIVPMTLFVDLGLCLSDHACMHVCMCRRTTVFIFVFTFVYMYAHAYIYIYIHIYIYIYACAYMRIHLYVRTHIHTYVCMCAPTQIRI